MQYGRLARTDLFRQGLDRVQKEMEEYRIALMCAEKEPLECHRTILVGRHLAALGIDVQHIHADGRIETHAAAVSRLRRMLRLPEDDMFRSSDDVAADAYRLQEERIAHDSSRETSADAPSLRSAAG